MKKPMREMLTALLIRFGINQMVNSRLQEKSGFYDTFLKW